MGSEISGAVSGVTTPGASRLQASQSQQRSTTMQRLQGVGLVYPASPRWGLVCFGHGLWCCFSFAGCLWCSWLGLGFGLLMGRVWLHARSACPPPFAVPVCSLGVRAGVWVSAAPCLSLGGCWGVCVLVRPSRVVSCTSWLGLLCGGVCLCTRPACSLPFLAGVRSVGVRAGPRPRLCPALLGWVVGVCSLRFFFWARLGLALWCRLLAVPVPGLVVPVPRSPLLSAWAAGSFFFPAWCVSACFAVPFPAGPLFLAWCCLFWLGAPPVPLWGSCLRCLLGGGFGRLLWCWRAVWWLWAVLSPPPSPPPCVFSFWGGGCLFLPLPSLGWRMHWPSFSVVFRAAVGGCVLLGRVPAPWVGWVMYTLGSAPLPVGLGPGSAGWAAAPGVCVWLWVRGLGLSVSFLPCGAGFNLLGGPPLLLPGARWPRLWPAVPVCGLLLRRLPGCAMACFG